MPFLSATLDLPFLQTKMLIMSSNERFSHLNIRLVNFQVLYSLSVKDKKRTFFH